MLLFFNFVFTQCNKTAKKGWLRAGASCESKKDGSHICTMYVWHSSNKWERNHLNMKLLSWRTGRRDTECTALHACVCVRWVLVSISHFFAPFVSGISFFFWQMTEQTQHTHSLHKEKECKKARKVFVPRNRPFIFPFCLLSYSICFSFFQLHNSSCIEFDFFPLCSFFVSTDVCTNNEKA